MPETCSENQRSGHGFIQENREINKDIALKLDISQERMPHISDILDYSKISIRWVVTKQSRIAVNNERGPENTAILSWCTHSSVYLWFCIIKLLVSDWGSFFLMAYQMLYVV